MARDLDFERSIFSHQEAQTAPAGSLFDTFADKVMRRVDEVLAGRQCKWPPSPEVCAFLQLLRSHQGKRRSVPAGLICERMKISPRKAKDLAQEIRLDFRVQLGASREAESGGYYLVATEEESVESTEQMFAQAITMLLVVGVMRGGRAAIDQMLTQIALDLRQEDAHV